jgi:protein-S-isoprenylcysteine O-methyltransferase Ste14
MSMVSLGNFLYHHRLAIFPAFVVGVLLLAKPQYFWDDPKLDIYADVVGFLIALLGQQLRALTIGYAYIKRGGKKRQVHADALVEGGVFAHSRNPLYLGNILIFVGLALIIHAKEVYVIGVPLVLLAYRAIIAAEEHYLSGKFGDAYARYCRRVNRLWPRWRGFSTSVADMRFDWKRVIRKDYNTMIGWLAAAIAFRMWSTYTLSGTDHLRELAVLSLLFIPLAAGYGLARYMKKTKQLV